ncbi:MULTISPECIES: ribonuclease HII [Pseudonocardia]|uniref:Ribonuclease HII n=2 Tax=Pseudonocardia TaxID=1847 RepID=A0A1Y2N2T9_PSEAH|nr:MULTISPECIES: ribonuclease HII [Pseudonocardia]OSY41218.1 Ribonuclease HII [Pseudonocardia autotrophica]TDN76674.1 RNase HII [Pseudonocardia autotrophica]BBG00674.1 ribonuclease HII [Pseudonocardia autotrophica]GEC24360.1 ribonuclease HII [Pseudonocardia saturnea]
MLPDGLRPPRAVVRDAGSWTLQSVLQRYGLGPVAGVDEAGRGASAGPLVIAACVLRPGDAKALDGLTDSKLLTPSAREYWFGRITGRAVDRAVIVVPPAEVDRRGVHVANIEGMRRAVAGLTVAPPGYVLTDGFAVRGFGRPALAVPKGDQVAACIAAASVLAKVTRDRIMTELDAVHDRYGFAVHKGYNTPDHEAALYEHGPCAEHRFSFANVAAVAGRGAPIGLVHNEEVPEGNEEVPEGVDGAAEEADPTRWEPMEIVTGGAGR